MRTHPVRVSALALVLVLAACTSALNGTEITDAVDSTVAPPAPATDPIEQPAAFPIETFAAISEDPLSEELAAEFQAALTEMLNLPLQKEIVAGRGGMT